MVRVRKRCIGNLWALALLGSLAVVQDAFLCRPSQSQGLIARQAALAGGDESAARAEAKQKLLNAIKHFKEVQDRTGATPSVDFGVKGGELDKKDRSPKNLAADGAFRRISEELGDAVDQVLALAEQLADCTPDPEPLRSFGTGRGAAECPLHGAWRLLFTTAADATFSKNSTRGAARVCNVVDAVAGTVTNCIDFETSETGKPPALESLRVRLTAVPETAQRLALAFRFVRARVTRLFGIPLGGRRWTITLPVPGPLLSRVISIITRKPPPKPYFDVLFLDDTLRVHKTGQGNLFVQERTDLPELL